MGADPHTRTGTVTFQTALFDSFLQIFGTKVYHILLFLQLIPLQDRVPSQSGLVRYSNRFFSDAYGLDGFTPYLV